MSARAKAVLACCIAGASLLGAVAALFYAWQTAPDTKSLFDRLIAEGRLNLPEDSTLEASSVQVVGTYGAYRVLTADVALHPNRGSKQAVCVVRGRADVRFVEVGFLQCAEGYPLYDLDRDGYPEVVLADGFLGLGSRLWVVECSEAPSIVFSLLKAPEEESVVYTALPSASHLSIACSADSGEMHARWSYDESRGGFVKTDVNGRELAKASGPWVAPVP